MTIDEVYQTPKGIVINDIKTTSQTHLDAWAVQLGGYRAGYENQHDSISGTAILQLFKKGTYTVYDIKDNYSVFLVCL